MAQALTDAAIALFGLCFLFPILSIAWNFLVIRPKYGPEIARETRELLHVPDAATSKRYERVAKERRHA